VTEEEDVMQRADALMRRHRVFVAGAADKTEPEAGSGDEDIPLLTEVVAAGDHVSDLPANIASLDPAELRSALAFEMEAWLDQELPQHVMRVLDGITDQLIIQLSLKARADLLPRLQNILATRQQAAKPDSADD